MQRISFEISVDTSRTDAFVIASAKFISGNLGSFFGNNIPQVVPLQLSDGKREVFVGCLTGRPHNQQPFKLLMSVALAEDLELKDGQVIQCIPVYNPIKTTRVFVLPATVDESEVVEQNASLIEAHLLRQIQVVFPGMVISVFVCAGVHAKVVVQKIENAHGEEVTSGCAIMYDGTEFVIATRTRQETPINDGNNNTSAGGPPSWAVLRCQKPEEINSHSEVMALCVNPITAARYNWTEGLMFGFWDLARMSQLLETQEIAPSFIRSHARKIHLRFSNDVPVETCVGVTFDQASNVVVYPYPDESVPEITKDNIELENTSSSALPKALVSYHDILKVHGIAARELLEHLQSWLTWTRKSDLPCTGNSNVLICGGKGYGKTTVITGVLSQLRDVHVCVVPCTSSGKQLLLSLQEALVECVLCAPSILVLDTFDAIAPVQKEGSVAAISGPTKCVLEDILRCFADVFTLVGKSSVTIIATCCNREDVNESLRSAGCFSKVIKLEALTRQTRNALMRQLLRGEPTETVERIASMMDNYTPFDITHVTARIKKHCKDHEFTLEAAKEAIASFTPLSHTGITFLKGGKTSWDSIGGLPEAKKILYDTLVLPMKHPELFARLPLKTRSGVLLYGPPGCGKTFIVEAVVNAENLNCIVVNGPEVFGKYIGQSEQKIRDVFERAHAAAPCVIFFDEFDSVAPQRGVDNSGVTDRVVNQLLCYLDGVEDRKDVYVVAASSRPDLIDAALLRPGRLDKAVHCPIPSYEERREILNNCLNKASGKLTPEEIDSVAEKTANWTPADLAGMVSSASLVVSRRVIEQLTLDGIAGSGVEDSLDFAVVNVGKGTSHEKIQDSLKSFLGIKQDQRKINVDTYISFEDVQCALSTTRSSLTPLDISKFERIHRLISGQGAGIDKKREAGTKLAFQ